MRRGHDRSDPSASCCNSRAWLALRHIETEGNTAPTATDQRRVLLRRDQSRAKGSGSDAMAF